jgi:threonine/homoserine/homoserine lactone efflux protein
VAIVGVVLAVIAAFLKATKQDPSVQFWLLILAVILIGLDVAFVWYHGGRYNRRGPVA